ncbi:MAG: MotE family protein [Thermodesulfobacteriota bacterium]
MTFFPGKRVDGTGLAFGAGQWRCLGLALLLALAASPAVAADKGPVKVTSEEAALAASLKSREDAIAVREQAVAAKEAELKQLAKEVDEKYARLIARQEELKKQIGGMGGVREQRFRNLVKIYTTMSPSKVAPLLDKMDDDEATEILKAMKAEQVAKILPKIEPTKAVRLSRQLGLL